ncbi:MAG: hypothetical protein Q8P93_00530 [bacterium]|nr:hypothetical protein [bacterium]
MKNTIERRIDEDRKVRRFVKGEIPTDILVYSPQQIKSRRARGDFFITRIIRDGIYLYGSR